jgi:prophage tail gpP-like protein
MAGEIQRRARHSRARHRARLAPVGWSLWRLNQLVAVRIPFLSLDMELLIAGVRYQLNAHRGRHTELTVGPIDGYQPDPGQVRKHRGHHSNRHKGGAGTNWDGVGKAGSEASYTV